MNKTILAAAGFAAILVSIPAIADPSSSTLTVADGMSRLGFNLFAKLEPASSSKNMVMSPLSIDQALALLYNGARGGTQRSCSTVMGLSNLTMSQANSGFSDLGKSLTSADPAVQFDIANAIWPNKGEKLDAQYAERCRKYLGATVEPLDYHNPVAAASTINGWVDDHTRHNIRTLVGPSDVRDASVVLTNAIYFHGKWTTPFNKNGTHDAKFETPNGSKSLPTMHREGEMDYVADPHYQAVSLPYGNGGLQMLIALPRPGADISSMVDDAWWTDVTGRMKPEEVALALPRFKASYGIDILHPLKELGLPASGDYSGIAIGGLTVSAIIHKATVDVDEDGTVASAATGIVMTKAIRAAGAAMTVDRPFFFAIYDRQTRAVLFTGVIRDPSES